MSDHAAELSQPPKTAEPILITQGDLYGLAEKEGMHPSAAGRAFTLLREFNQRPEAHHIGSGIKDGEPAVNLAVAEMIITRQSLPRGCHKVSSRIIGLAWEQFRPGSADQ
jgi:hypothetical protein